MADPGLALTFWPRFLLAVLATWRVAHLLANEDGPADAVLRLRAWLGDSMPGRMMDCFYCLSLWVAAPLALYLATTPVDWLPAWLGLSGATCLLERAVPRTDRLPLPNTGEKGDEHGMLWPEARRNEEPRANDRPCAHATPGLPAIDAGGRAAGGN